MKIELETNKHYNLHNNKSVYL